MDKDCPFSLVLSLGLSLSLRSGKVNKIRSDDFSIKLELSIELQATGDHELLFDEASGKGIELVEHCIVAH